MMPKALLAWSSGKDSALALYEVQKQRALEVVGLFTTIRGDNHTINIHGVHESWVDAQAEELELPLTKIYLPHPCSNTEYESHLTKALIPFKEKGVTHLIFGDLFLEDIRQYREGWLKKNGFRGAFPLWGKNTPSLAEAIVKLGFKAKIVAIDPKRLSASALGQTFDQKFVAALPSQVDPCGENGEFHTFVYDGPNFKHAVFSVDTHVKDYQQFFSPLK